MGSFIFGYDTGQISGFLGMPEFLSRFGQRNSDGSGYHFSNVRAGLIVALVSTIFFLGRFDLTISALCWHPNRRLDCRSRCRQDRKKMVDIGLVSHVASGTDCSNFCNTRKMVSK
jgi:hypothetical protein